MEDTYNNLEDLRNYINEFGYTFKIQYEGEEGLIEPAKEDVIDFANIVFRGCREVWSIKEQELSVLIDKYNLVAFLERHFG